MIHKALRRANRSYVFILVSALLFVAGFVGSTYAYFDGQAQLTATYAGGIVIPPSTPTATASGYDGLLTWTAPRAITTTYTTPTTTYSATTTPGVQGERIVAVDNGTTSNCTGVTYGTTVAASLPKTQSTYTDTNRASGSGNGHQWCYAIQSYWTTNSWYSQVTVPVAQLGLAAKSASASNVGTAGTVDRNDLLVITYNQKPATPSTGVMCAFPSDSTLLIGDTDCTDVNNDSYAIAKVTGVTFTGNGTDPIPLTLATSGGMVISATAPWTITLKIRTNSGATIGGWGSASFTNSSTLKSSITTRQASGCTSCSITPGGSW